MNNGTISDNPGWANFKAAEKDESLKSILQEIKSVPSAIYGSQVEGSFYKKELFAQVCDIIERHYDYTKMEVAYAREEVYFSTIVWGLINNGANIRVFKKGIFTWIPWKRQFTANVRIKEIKKLVDNQFYYAVKRVPRVLNDCVRVYIRKGKYTKDLAFCGAKEYPYWQLVIMEWYKQLNLYYGVIKKGLKNPQKIFRLLSKKLKPQGTK